MAFPAGTQHLLQKALPDEADQFIAELFFGQGIAPSKFLSRLCVRLLQFILCECGLAGVGILRPVDHRLAHVAVTDLGRFVGDGQLQSSVALVRDVECLERRIPRVLCRHDRGRIHVLRLFHHVHGLGLPFVFASQMPAPLLHIAFGVVQYRDDVGARLLRELHEQAQHLRGLRVVVRVRDKVGHPVDECRVRLVFEYVFHDLEQPPLVVLFAEAHVGEVPLFACGQPLGYAVPHPCGMVVALLRVEIGHGRRRDVTGDNAILPAVIGGVCQQLLRHHDGQRRFPAFRAAEYQGEVPAGACPHAFYLDNGKGRVLDEPFRVLLGHYAAAARPRDAVLTPFEVFPYQACRPAVFGLAGLRGRGCRQLAPYDGVKGASVIQSRFHKRYVGLFAFCPSAYLRWFAQYCSACCCSSSVVGTLWDSSHCSTSSRLK